MGFYNKSNLIFVGQRIVCTEDRFPVQVFDWGSALPKKGAIYTICWRIETKLFLVPDRVASSYGLLLRELSNPGHLLHFDQNRFAPLVEGEQPDLDEVNAVVERFRARIGEFINYPAVSQTATF